MNKRTQNISTLCTLFVTVFCLFVHVQQASANSVYILNSILKIEDGKILAGVYDVRLSLWKKETPEKVDFQEKSVRAASPNYAGYVEEHTVISATNGSFNVAVGALSDISTFFADSGVLYMQVDVKPSGTDQSNWHPVALPQLAGKKRLPILLSELRPSRIRFETTYGIYGGVLLDKSGAPIQGNYLARFSVWSSPNLDELSDFLGDGTIRTASSNYQGYQVEVPFTTDKFGRFTFPVGPFPTNFNPQKNDTYIQLDVREQGQPLYDYDLIDPDGDIKTRIDRFLLQNDRLIAQDNDSVARIGETEKLMVSNIPNGTSSRYFELGVGDSDPVGYYEIRVRQQDGQAAVLRYNGVERIWEVSNDGIVYHPFGGYYDGTPAKKFTIGLGDRGDSKLGLQFGEGLASGLLSFDPDRDVFVINKSVDFQGGQLINAVLENRASPPPNPVSGQQYFDTSDSIAYYYNGSSWIAMGGGGGFGGYTPTPGIFGNTTVIVSGGPAGPQGPQGPAGPPGAGATIALPLNWSDIATRNRDHTFGGEALEQAIVGNASLGKGKLESAYDSLVAKTHFRWTTRQSSGSQDIVLALEWKLPEDFAGFQAIPLLVELRTLTTLPGDAHISVNLKQNGVSVPLTGASSLTSSSANTWTTSNITFAGAPTFAPGDRVTIELVLSVSGANYMDLGDVRLQYIGQ